MNGHDELRIIDEASSLFGAVPELYYRALTEFSSPVGELAKDRRLAGVWMRGPRRWNSALPPARQDVFEISVYETNRSGRKAGEAPGIRRNVKAALKIPYRSPGTTILMVVARVIFFRLHKSRF